MEVNATTSASNPTMSSKYPDVYKYYIAECDESIDDCDPLELPYLIFFYDQVHMPEEKRCKCDTMFVECHYTGIRTVPKCTSEGHHHCGKMKLSQGLTNEPCKSIYCKCNSQ